MEWLNKNEKGLIFVELKQNKSSKKDEKRERMTKELISGAQPKSTRPSRDCRWDLQLFQTFGM